MTRPRDVKMWICIGIAYNSPLIPQNGQPALVTRTLTRRHWERLDWFPRDVWPWFPNRLGRLSA